MMKIESAAQGLARRLTQQQGNLLRAAVLDDVDEAGDAYRHWAGSVDWEKNFDAGTYQLLPLLYLNLDRAGVEDANTGRLRGLYRRSWYRNQRLMSNLNSIAGKLSAAGVDVVLLGDIALLNGLYDLPGARIVNRLDLLIDRDAVTDALGCLTATGWAAPLLRDDDLTYEPYTDLTDPAGEVLRIHWHPWHRQCADDGYSFAAFDVRRDCSAASPPVPAHTGLLLHLVANSPEPGEYRLLADIAATHRLANSGEVDWDAALTLADELRVNMRLYSACACVRSELAASIPEEVLQELGRRTVSVPERLERRLARRSAELPDAFFGPLFRLLAEYARYANGSGAARTLANLPAFLRHHYRTRSIARIVVRVLGNGARRIVRLVTGASVKSPA